MPNASELELRLRSLSSKLATSQARRDSIPDPTGLARTLARLDAEVRLRSEADYPAGLLDLEDPPSAVFCRGRIPQLQNAVAIVGSRAATPYGRTQASRLAGDLVSLGLTVVSGLARGVDAASHRGALDAGGKTVAVLPGGLDAVVPRHHVDLAERIATQGGLITETARGAPTFRAVFVRRNRLIAALSSATVVVEAAERSGALSTAVAAQRLGRPVLAVPGDVDRPTSRGCHALLKAGARLCERAGDVMNALLESAGPTETHGSTESRVLARLSVHAQTVDALAKNAGVSTSETLAALLKLEWSGAAVSTPGQRWARRASTR